MPTLVELRSRFVKQRDSHLNLSSADEFLGDDVLVADVRGRLTPAQVVEQKLRSLLPKARGLGAPLSRTRGGPNS